MATISFVSRFAKLKNITKPIKTKYGLVNFYRTDAIFFFVGVRVMQKQEWPRTALRHGIEARHRGRARSKLSSILQKNRQCCVTVHTLRLAEHDMINRQHSETTSDTQNQATKITSPQPPRNCDDGEMPRNPHTG